MKQEADGSVVVRIIKNGAAIDSVDAWFALAPPKKAFQWKDTRSAKGLAKGSFII